MQYVGLALNVNTLLSYGPNHSKTYILAIECDTCNSVVKQCSETDIASEDITQLALQNRVIMEWCHFLAYFTYSFNLR